ncbi:MAG: hypothetical protein IKI75_12750 [Lachnospiraceae bacterium]|nr:hypothetical protein [Lachnospiraceae bacterium]
MIREKEIDNEICFLQDNLEKLYDEIGHLRAKTPEGVRLRAVRHGDRFQYFMRHRGERNNGEYIKQKDVKLAAMLAQLEYDEKLISIIEQAVESLEMCKESLPDTVFNEVLRQIAPGKKELIQPCYVSDEIYIKSWKEQEYEGVAFREEAAKYYTRRSLRVRSKSEVMIADILDEAGIPFLYEKPLKLKHTTVHPDFTLLNVRERKEIYWEHFGMMDDREYRDNAYIKIREYEESGFYQFDSVIRTFETSRYPLNTRDIRKMVKLLKEKITV